MIAIARVWGGNATALDVLDRLAVDAPQAADLVREALGALGPHAIGDRPPVPEARRVAAQRRTTILM